MPSFRECIIAAAKNGLVSKDREKEMLDMFDDNLEQFSKSMSDAEATKAASNATFLAQKRKVKTKAIENTISVVKEKELKELISQYKNSNDEIDIGQGFRALHGKAEGKRILKNLEIRQRSIFSYLMKNQSDLMEAYANRLILKYKRANPKSLIDEMFEPGSTGNKGAEMMAKALSDSFEKSRIMLAKNGVAIAKDPNWKFPQVHDTTKIKKSKITDEGWVNYIKPLLDRSKMIDDKTGLTFDKLPDQEYNKALMASFNNIITDGLGVGKKTGLKKFQESRFLIFKDANSFYEYNLRFGGDNPIQMTYQHLDTVSRAIAETELFGPKPTTVRNSLKKYVLDESRKVRLKPRKRLGGLGKGKFLGRREELDRANEFIKKADAEYDLFVGKGYLTDNKLFAKIGSGFRNYTTGTLLSGSGPVVLVGDLATTFNNAALRGWSPWMAVLKSLREQFKGKQGRQDAAYLEIILDDMIQNNMAMSRFMEDADSGGFSKAYSTALLRAGGVSRFTQQGRNAGGKFILSDSGLGQYTKYSYDQLIKEAKGTFNKFGKTIKLLEQYGITKQEWDLIRTTKKWNPRGNLKFIDPGAIASRTDVDEKFAREAAFKLKDLVQTEQDHMVVVNSLRQQARSAQLRRGTFAGEFGLSAFMFKSFPINIIIHNIQRAFTAPPGLLNKAKYTAVLTGGMTLSGATILLLNDIVNGKDPRDVNTGTFWTQAILKGGALGPFGDTLVGDPDARELGFLLSGPIVGLFGDLLGITGGALYQAVAGEEEVNYGGRVSRFIRSWFPKPFYLKLLLQRYLFDQIDYQINNNHYKNRRRRERLLYEKGSDYWWKPTELLPERPPQLTE